MKKKKIVIDVDGVILNIHGELENRLKKFDNRFRMANVLTYDFNKSLDSSIFLETLGKEHKQEFDSSNDFGLFVQRKDIFTTLGDIELFKSCKPYENVIEIINNIPKEEYDVIIHTYGKQPEIAAFKTMQIHELLGHIAGITIVTSCGEYKPALECDYAIEDSIDSFAHFSPYFGNDEPKYFLISMPFNQKIYNENSFKSLGSKEKRLKRVPNLSIAISKILNSNNSKYNIEFSQPKYIEQFGKPSFTM